MIEQRFHPDLISIYGATGGRIDHLLANLFCLLRPEFLNMISKVEFIDKNNVIRFYNPGEHEIKQIEGMRYLAFVSMGPVDDLNLYDENTDFVMPIFRALFRLQATNLFRNGPFQFQERKRLCYLEQGLKQCYFLIEQNADMTTFLAIK